MQIEIQAEENLSEEQRIREELIKEFPNDLPEHPAETAAKYKYFIEEARKRGGSKQSLNSLIQEWHRYTQNYPIPSLPVSLCMEFFNKTLTEGLAANRKPEIAKEQGRLAYCAVLPRLSNRESIRDFIACVVHAMALGIIPGPEGTRLLYGAQVAQAALPPTRRWRKDSAKIRQETATKCTQTAPKQPLNSAEHPQDQLLTQ